MIFLKLSFSFVKRFSSSSVFIVSILAAGFMCKFARNSLGTDCRHQVATCNVMIGEPRLKVNESAKTSGENIDLLTIYGKTKRNSTKIEG